MHSEQSFLINLVTILLASGIGGYLFRKWDQPKVLGQILAGVIVGPSILGLAHQTDFIANLAEIGVILLMFMAGLETDLEELKNSFHKSSAIAVGGVVLPFVMGVGGMYLFKGDLPLSEAVFVGVILTATSMGITVQMLTDMGRLQTSMGMSILGAAVIDDIAGVIILTIVMGVFGSGHTDVMGLMIKIAAFFGIIAIVGVVIKDFVKDNDAEIKKLKAIHLLGVSLIMVLSFAIFASELGMAAIIGAYFVGVIISTTQVKHRINHEIEKVGHGFFIPIFFANIGVGIDLGSIANYLWLALFVTFVGIVSKIVGSGIGAKMSGFSKKESVQIGISMIPRAEVALIVANLGLKAQLIGQDVYTSIIMLVIGTTIAAPLLLKQSEKMKDATIMTGKNDKLKVSHAVSKN